MAKKMYFPESEYERRWQGVYAEMRKRGYETAVIWGRTGGTYERSGNIVYLTNYYSGASGNAYSAAILHRGQTPELHMDLPFYDKALLATDRIKGHHGTPEAFKGVAEALNALRVNGKVAVCGTDFLPHNAGRYIEETCPQIAFEEEDDLTIPTRMIKSDLELDCYRHAGQIVSRALNRLIEGLVRGKTEAEAAADAAYEVTRAGGRFHMIPVSHGDTIMDWNRNPLAGFSEDAPQTGDMVRGWVYGPIYQGYWLDPGRTAIAGPIGVSGNREQKRIIEATANIVDELIASVKPGVKTADLVALGTRLWQEAGGEEDQAAEMFPIFGHGVGQSWEPPSLGIEGKRSEFTLRWTKTRSDWVLEENMTLGIEAFLGKKGVGSAGFESNIIVTKTGAELLTTTPMIWW